MTEVERTFRDPRTDDSLFEGMLVLDRSSCLSELRLRESGPVLRLGTSTV